MKFDHSVGKILSKTLFLTFQKVYQTMGNMKNLICWVYSNIEKSAFPTLFGTRVKVKFHLK